ncbi:MAG: hypothetical protein M1121_00880 [Actinobacteria bacterium]|nr:hypothetical protein [Actinomycetota bacterium]
MLREASVPTVLILVRLGVATLEDDHLSRSCQECFGRWGMWGFSVLEVPGGDYNHLARLRPIVAERRMIWTASGPELAAGGFPVLPTLDFPHWTVVLSEPTPNQFQKVRALFTGPVENPAWSRRAR